jgi:hypothetical protein
VLKINICLQGGTLCNLADTGFVEEFPVSIFMVEERNCSFPFRYQGCWCRLLFEFVVISQRFDKGYSAALTAKYSSPCIMFAA